MKIEITNQNKWHQSLTLKLALLAFLGLILLIPLEMIKEVILERQMNAENAKKDISDTWAAKQYFSGPVINIPVLTIPSEKDEKAIIKLWHILPDSLGISGNIRPEIRKRGIYKSVVYDSELKINGYFIVPASDFLKNYVVLWDEAYYTVGVTDNRGLKGRIILKTGSSELEAEPGVRDNDIFQSGITFLNTGLIPGQKLSFDMIINLSGSEGLYLTPLGKSTSARLRSEWQSPAFEGNFLPVKREINAKGFSAEWEVTHLNRNFPQNWVGDAFHPLESSFGVNLFQPDHYQKSRRSSRYGILFIALTFLVLIFLEITRKDAIHIIHYVLVSFGLILFFSLLNSISEQLGFNLAYLISSAATILLISSFTGALFRERKTGFIVFSMLVILYTFIFVLMSLNDYAYLAGNIGLFILLIIIMRLASNMELFKQ